MIPILGKWHLGFSQYQQLPTGRGFDKWTGCFVCNSDVITKRSYELPWHPLALDWGDFYANKTYKHYVDPRHVTTAITANAIEMIDEHVLQVEERQPAADFRSSDNSPSPLFLYVAYTAAHAPLQPDPRHLVNCSHIAHYWRRQYCGLIMGLDEGVKNITEYALEQLGDNTIFILMSDNGANPFFGGMCCIIIA